MREEGYFMKNTEKPTLLEFRVATTKIKNKSPVWIPILILSFSFCKWGISISLTSANKLKQKKI